MGFWTDVRDRIKGWKITVEPLVFVLAACNTAVGIVSPSMKEMKMKRVYPAPPDIHGSLEKYYNKKMVMWDNYYEYINLPIACIFGIIYGGYSDHRGRKYPLLIGIVSVLLSNAMNFLIWDKSTDWPLAWLYPTAAISGLFGDFFLTMSCINAYIADEFPNKIMLSYRMVVVSILFSLGSFAASRFVKYLINWTSTSTIMIIAEGGYLFTLLVSIFILKQKTPKLKNNLLRESITSSTNEDSENQENHSIDTVPNSSIKEKKSILEIIKISFISLYDATKIFLLPRAGHRRLFLCLCFAANFLDQFVWGEEKGLLGTYVRLPPFKWDPRTYADYKSWRPIVQIIGMAFGMLLFKRVFHFRDTFIICIAIFSMAGCVLVIGLAQASWMIFASLAPGSLHGLLNPMTYTFMACIVEPDEIGKTYAISSVAQQLAGIAQSLILQNIYIATVDWYQGFVWLLMAAICLVAVGIYFIVHVMAKRENVGS